jgi:hypothetical protein
MQSVSSRCNLGLFVVRKQVHGPSMPHVTKLVQRYPQVGRQFNLNGVTWVGPRDPVWPG